MPPSSRFRVVCWTLALFVVLLAGGSVLYEAKTSRLQSKVLSSVARDLTFRIEPGPSDSIRFPEYGPFDERRGFDRIPGAARTLAQRGFTISAQARLSPRLLDFVDRGIYSVYNEKPQAGLTLLDREGEPLYAASYPQRVYADYDSIPDLIVQTLLFIEDRELMIPGRPYRNPVLDWDRLVKASVDFGIGLLDADHPQPGASTLATQIEKFRHSAEGRTGSAKEKLRQMTSASLRAYLDGRDTRTARRRIVRDYVNSVPLAAVAGYGEINGLGDGLWAWYDTDLREVGRLLPSLERTGEPVDPEAARAFKQVLSLFIAQRRPSFYLIGRRDLLEKDTNRYLRILAESGIITPQLRDAALSILLTFRQSPPVSGRPSYIDRKAANAVRVQLLHFLEVDQLYALDRIDLTAETTLEGPLQRRLTRILERLRDPRYADSLSLIGPRLLERGDPAGVIYSFTLYEATRAGNLLRVQADNYDQPLDLNEGVKLELGSTAKLRTLVTYLEIVADLHARFAGKTAGDLREAAAGVSDPIRRWALGYLTNAPDTTLAAMLEGAMRRTYSASPKEGFFTGAGVHTFSNFDSKDDSRVLTVREGFQNSVNLVFIRLMRDLVRYYMGELPDYPAVLDDPGDPKRSEYLARFADQESKTYLRRFHRTHREMSPEASLELLADRMHGDRKRLAALFRTVRPEEGHDSLAAFLGRHAPTSRPSMRAIVRLYETWAPGAHDLHDRAAVLRVHPLELWVVAFRQKHPAAAWGEILAESVAARQNAYKWLFQTKSVTKQNKRIGIILENDAFVRIHRAWRRLGYPFASLVPSYATAIGSAADRPAALAELVGIAVNDGVHRPAIRLTRLHFGEGTPYETVLDHRAVSEERVIPREVARAVRRALIDVVENGTARRCAGSFRTANGEIPVGGKTGTGDQRYESTRREEDGAGTGVVNRTATFVFLIGDRFFGTITAYVPGPEATRYAFTSSLPVQLFRTLAPELLSLVGGEGTARTRVPD